MTTAAPTRTVTFVAPRHRNLLVTIEPQRRANMTDAVGNVIDRKTTAGKAAQFVNWKFETDDQETIDYLRNHDQFVDGSEPALLEALRAGKKRFGFYEAYDASRPAMEDRFAQIADLAADADLEALTELIADEESFGDGGREPVLNAARSASAKLEEQRAMIDPEAEAAGASPTGTTDEPEEPSGDGSGRD